MSAINWSTMSPREIWNALKSRPSVLGPWKKHEHSFGCDCGRSYPNGYWYREDVDGNEFIVVADLTAEAEARVRSNEDERLRKNGYLLLDT